MDKLRDWGFPIGLAVAWVIAVAWTLSSLLLAASVQRPVAAPVEEPPPAAWSTAIPPS